MNRRDFQPIFKEVVRRVPQFVAHKRLLLMVPMNGMLRAINFDPSAFSKDSFYPSTAIIPLCVPTNIFSLTWGARFKNPKEGIWTRDLPNLVDHLVEAIRTEALPFLESCRSADDFVRIVRPHWRNPHAPREAAFVLARAGDYDRAVAIIDKLLPTLDLDSPWQQEIFDGSTELRRLILKDPNEARRQLDVWEDYTIDQFKLRQFK